MRTMLSKRRRVGDGETDATGSGVRLPARVLAAEVLPFLAPDELARGWARTHRGGRADVARAFAFVRNWEISSAIPCRPMAPETARPCVPPRSGCAPFRLRTLKLGLSSTDGHIDSMYLPSTLSSIEALLAASAATLETLELDAIKDVNMPSWLRLWPSMPRLTTLRVDVGDVDWHDNGGGQRVDESVQQWFSAHAPNLVDLRTGDKWLFGAASARLPLSLRRLRITLSFTLDRTACLRRFFDQTPAALEAFEVDAWYVRRVGPEFEREVRRWFEKRPALRRFRWSEAAGEIDVVLRAPGAADMIRIDETTLSPPQLSWLGWLPPSTCLSISSVYVNHEDLRTSGHLQRIAPTHLRLGDANLLYELPRSDLESVRHLRVDGGKLSADVLTFSPPLALESLTAPAAVLSLSLMLSPPTPTLQRICVIDAGVRVPESRFCRLGPAAHLASVYAPCSVCALDCPCTRI